MRINHFNVDINRTIVPISATKIREKPLTNWQYISEAARPYFVKKVVVQHRMGG
jgi:HTH-type transcriptional repressor of NAD biosynthesis genes